MTGTTTARNKTLDSHLNLLCFATSDPCEDKILQNFEDPFKAARVGKE